MEKLTQKEIDLIKLKAEGMTHRQVAKRLFIATRYVDKIITGLYSKTGCKSVGSLIKWSFENGVLKINTSIPPSEERKVG
jgi:DNA-binding CsgD family transcriptional regulator